MNAIMNALNASMNLFGAVFQDRVMSRPLWPPQSPDLIPLDFYLWGELKSTVCKNKSKTTDEHVTK
jgi:hypothetical protein